MSVTVGLLGCGRWGRLILRDLLAAGARVEVVAPSPASREYARTHGAHDAHGSIPDSFASLDGFVVASPTVLHATHIEQLLPLGKPVYTEKAMCLVPERARQLAEAGRGRLFVMHKWRYHAGIRKLAELVRAGDLGVVDSMRLLRLGWANPHRDVDGATILLPHDLSICLHVLGRIPPLQAAMATCTDPADGGIIALLGGPGEPTVTLEYSIVHPQSHRSFSVVGSTGAAMLGDSYADDIVIRRAAPAMVVDADRLPAPGPMPLAEELRVFVEHLRGGVPPMSPAHDSVAIIERMVEIRREVGLPELCDA